MLFNLLFFAGLIVIFVLVSKRNFRERMEELKNNLSKFNEDIKNFFYSLPLDSQEKFMNTEDDVLTNRLRSILENNFIYGNTVWSVQQQIVQSQEIFEKLKKVAGRI